MFGNFFKVSKQVVKRKYNLNSFGKSPFATKIQSEPAVNKQHTTGKSPSKEFEKHVNDVSKSQNENYSSIEQYMKVFNDKVYKQNVDLTNKLIDIYKDDKAIPGAKIFNAVNEINKMNLNNSSTLLQVFLNQIMKYNDSVKLFIQQSEKKNARFGSLLPITILLIWICGGIFLYSFYKRNFINNEKLFANLVEKYNDEAPSNFKINVKYPIFDEHSNVGNSIKYELYKHIVLIGPASIGKTESVKHFCLSQCLKDLLTIYVDLNSIDQNTGFSIEAVVRDILVKNYNGSEISNLNENLIHNKKFAHQLFEYLKNNEVCFVFDNYEHERDNKRILQLSIPNITQNPNWKSLIVSNNNEILQNALENHLEVQYVNFLQTKTFKNYLFEKLNSYSKKRVEYSNLELFTENNLNNIFKQFYFFSFNDVFNYLESNNSIESKFLHNYYTLTLFRLFK